MQGVLTTREQSRERRVEVTTPAAAPDTQVTITGPDTPYGEDDGGYLDGYRDGYYDGDYPNHGPRRPHRDHDDRPGHGRPDETPVVNPPRRISGYAPAPPSIRQVAPRPPSSRPLPGNRGSATVPPNTPRDDERRGPP